MAVDGDMSPARYLNRSRSALAYARVLHIFMASPGAASSERPQQSAMSQVVDRFALVPN
jgi:hypothetical protein